MSRYFNISSIKLCKKVMENNILLFGYHGYNVGYFHYVQTIVQGKIAHAFNGKTYIRFQ